MKGSSRRLTRKTREGSGVSRPSAKAKGQRGTASRAEKGPRAPAKTPDQEPPGRATTGWPAWAKGFLIALGKKSNHANVSAACRAAGIRRRKAYDLRDEDESFREAWEEVVEGFLDDLEAETARRAFEGVEKPVFYQGEKCGSIREFSDGNAQFILKARRRAVYGEKVALTNADGSAFAVVVRRASEERRPAA